MLLLPLAFRRSCSGPTVLSRCPHGGLRPEGLQLPSPPLRHPRLPNLFLPLSLGAGSRDLFSGLQTQNIVPTLTTTCTKYGCTQQVHWLYTHCCTTSTPSKSGPKLNEQSLSHIHDAEGYPVHRPAPKKHRPKASSPAYTNVKRTWSHILLSCQGSISPGKTGRTIPASAANVCATKIAPYGKDVRHGLGRVARGMSTHKGTSKKHFERTNPPVPSTCCGGDMKLSPINESLVTPFRTKSRLEFNALGRLKKQTPHIFCT